MNSHRIRLISTAYFSHFFESYRIYPIRDVVVSVIFLYLLYKIKKYIFKNYSIFILNLNSNYIFKHYGII